MVNVERVSEKSLHSDSDQSDVSNDYGHSDGGFKRKKHFPTQNHIEKCEFFDLDQTMDLVSTFDSFRNGRIEVKRNIRYSKNVQVTHVNFPLADCAETDAITFVSRMKDTKDLNKLQENKQKA